MPTTQSLIQANIDALHEGRELLRLLESKDYTSGYKPAFHSTIGAHFRHVLEHYRCFISQLETGVICYDRRERNALLETDIDFAARTLVQLTQALAQLGPESFRQSYQMADELSDGLVATSLQRELLFLQSHTMHHYAIIGAMARAFGKQPKQGFGIAIATLNHEQEISSDGFVGGNSTCAQ